MVSGSDGSDEPRTRRGVFPSDDWRRRAAEFNEPRLSRNLRWWNYREIGNGHE